MTAKRTKTPAATAVSASAKGKSVLVFASADSGLITAPDSMKQILSAELASFGCKACGTQLTASAESKPFCIHCGSEEVEPTGEPVSQEIENLTDEDVAAVQCSSCNVTNVVSSKALAGSKHLHCSCCSTKLALTADADEFPMNDEEDRLESADVDDGGDASSVFNSVDEDDGMGIDLDDTDAMMADLDEDDGIVDELGDEPVANEEAEGLPPALVDPVDDLGSEVVEMADELDPGMDLVNEPSEGDTLMDSLDMADDDAGFSTAYVAGRLVAMRGHITVASLTKANAGASADLIATAGFANAVAHSVKAKGLRKGLRAMAFKPVRVPTLSKASVSRQVASVQQKAANDVVSRIATFNDSLALAAAGLSRGKWRGYENPLRAAFEVELVRAGIRNPSRISASIFSKNAVPFTKSLVEIASKLSKMSADARKELADVLDMTEDTPGEVDQLVSAEDDASPFAETDFQDDEAPVSLESRLNTTAALLRPRATNTIASASVLDSARSVLSGKAPLTFFNA